MESEFEGNAASPPSLPIDTLTAAVRNSNRHEQRRQLHREVVARSRARQRARVALLVHQETAMRRQLTQLLLTGPVNDSLAVNRLYAELVASQQTLLRENYALERLVHRHYLFSRLVQLERSHVLDRESETGDKQEKGVWLDFVTGEPPFFYEYASPLQCAHLVSVCFHLTSYLHTVFDRETHLQVDVAHILGWHAQRAIHWNTQLDKQMLYFKFSRTVAMTTATPQEIQEWSWRVLSSPSMQARLYSIPVTMQIAQAIDANALIVLQHKAYHVPVWFVCLNAQACEPGIVRQSMMVLDKPPPMSMPNVVWLREGIICLTFAKDAATGTVEITFAGCMRCVDDRHAQFMLLDVAWVLVRWENLVLPPRLLVV